MAEFQFDSTSIALLAVAAVLAVLAIGLLVYVVRHGKRDAAASEEAPEPRELAPGESATLASVLAGGASADPFLMKFVEGPAGERVGETITATDDSLILKHEGRFLAVPLEKVTVKDDELTADADVDWEEAARAGEAWREARHDAIEYDEHGNPIPKA